MTEVLSENDITPNLNVREVRRDYEWQIVWRNVFARGGRLCMNDLGPKRGQFGATRMCSVVFAFLYLHVCSLYAFYLMLSGAVKVQTIIFSICLLYTASLGLTAGAHRLWSHRAYRARWPLRLFLAVMQTVSFQNHIYEWARDHRVHHKFSETDADPHNARRGFFFAHMGWLMLRKHKDVLEKGASIDMSDLERDPIIMFQKKMFLVIMPLLCFIIPACVPVWGWGENSWRSWYVAAIWRYTMSLHGTWLLNSVAHLWGNKPYDKNIFARDIKAVAVITGGEGWHNYHHVFPWDYKAGEMGHYSSNFSTAFIDLAAKCGLAYDLKSVSSEMIQRRTARTGDGTHPSAKTKKVVNDDAHDENPVWGWDDKDMTEEEKNLSKITFTVRK